MSSLPGYDAWATGGRYSTEPVRVRCGECERWSSVQAETEYGATTWTPEECRHCGAPFDGDSLHEPDEPPEPDYEPEDHDRPEPWA